MVLILKALIAALLAAALPLAAPAAAEKAEAPAVSALSAILTTESGDVLFARDADRLLPIASTTKLMTALVVLDHCRPEDSIEILQEYCGVEGSSMYLRPGERYTVRELLTGLLLASGNDAALALAGHCAGSTAAFSALMNEKAAALGMENSHFLNPHGLNEAAHYSTARDLAALMGAVMRNDTLAELIALPSAAVGGQTIYNHNKLLSRYPGCIGGKTGYTQAAGRCLVSCAEREGTRLICVTLNDPDDWNSHMALYDWGFSRVETRVFNAENTRFELPLLGGRQRSALAVPAVEERLLVTAGSELRLRPRLPFYVFAPVSAGAAAGTLEIWEGERLLLELQLIYAAEYPIK